MRYILPLYSLITSNCYLILMHSLIEMAKRMQALAQTGLTYAQDPYDRERYEEIREMAVSIMAEASGETPEVVRDLFAEKEGYPTAMVDVRGVVFREDRILLVKEGSDGRWALPGGWADVGTSPREAVTREVWEEAGFKVNPTRLLALLDKKMHPHPPQAWYVYKLFILCEITGGEALAGHETRAVDFFPQDALPPLSLHRVLPEQIDMCFRLKDQPDAPTLFD